MPAVQGAVLGVRIPPQHGIFVEILLLLFFVLLRFLLLHLLPPRYCALYSWDRKTVTYQNIRLNISKANQHQSFFIFDQPIFG